MSTLVTLSIHLSVHDEEEFRQTAYNRAIDDGLSEEEAKLYLQWDEKSLGECACMILDPGVSPNGADIIASDWDEQEDDTDEDE